MADDSSSALQNEENLYMMRTYTGNQTNLESIKYGHSHAHKDIIVALMVRHHIIHQVLKRTTVATGVLLHM